MRRADRAGRGERGDAGTAALPAPLSAKPRECDARTGATPAQQAPRQRRWGRGGGTPLGEDGEGAARVGLPERRDSVR